MVARCWCGVEIPKQANGHFASVNCPDHSNQRSKPDNIHNPSRVAELKAFSPDALTKVCDEMLERWIFDMDSTLISSFLDLPC